MPPEGRTRHPLASCLFVCLCLGLLPAGPARTQPVEPPPAAEPESQPPALPALLRVHTEAIERGTRLVLEGSAPLTFDYASPDPQDAEVELLGTLAPSLREGLAVSTPEVETVQLESLAEPGAPPKVKISVHLTRPLVHRALARGDDVFLTFTALPGERLPDDEAEEEAAAEAAALGEGPPSEPPAGATQPETSAPAVGPAAAATMAPAEAGREPVPVEPKAAPAPAVPLAAVPAPDVSSTTPATADQPAALALEVQPPSPPTAAEPALADAPAATRLMGIGATFREGKVAVRLHADGRLSVHAFYVDELPHRLVLDLDGVENHVGSSRLAVNLSPVQAVRVAQHSVSPRLMTRVVVDLAARAPYRIEEHADGLTAWIDSDEPMPE